MSSASEYPSLTVSGQIDGDRPEAIAQGGDRLSKILPISHKAVQQH
jgi:hypothetical protein